MLSAEVPLVLGSSSPRRREILSGLGLPIRVSPADVSEELLGPEEPLSYVKRIVADKLAAVQARVRAEPHSGILVADTIVVIDGDVIGKPKDFDEAAAILARLVGRTHTVFTRYAISAPPAARAAVAARTVESRVTMRAANRDEVLRYAHTGEGLDKAGAYAVQGLGAFLIERIQGSYTNVVGLPACEVVLDLLALKVLDRFPLDG